MLLREQKRSLKKIVHFILARAFALINSFIPKDKKTIMFISTFEFGDNPRYLFEEMINNELFRDYRFVWVVTRKSKFSAIHDKYWNVTFVEYRTLSYLLEIFRAKYLVLGHGTPYWKAWNQIAIQLWHGIPLKIVGNYFLSKKSMKLNDYFITTSKFVCLLFSASFGISFTKFISLGQPRCDALFFPLEKARKSFKEILNIRLERYNSIIMYLPTFRDYDEMATQKIVKEVVSNDKLREFLKKNNMLLVVKPHPHDERLFEEYTSDNIKILKNQNLSERFLTLYDILPAVDILITDYSSVYFDYLLLNRPIVFYAPDLEEYRRTRGFLLEPYERWTPGDKARNISELIEALEEALTNPDKWRKEREWLRDVMFKYQDGKSSERIIKYFWGDT